MTSDEPGELSTWIPSREGCATLRLFRRSERRRPTGAIAPPGVMRAACPPTGGSRCSACDGGPALVGHACSWVRFPERWLSARWDQAYSALIDDLGERGLLGSTMVVAWGEFGHAPTTNATAGRDHWPNVFGACSCGGRHRGGRVIGSSDAKGGEPKENPKTPQDVLATIYRHLGVDVSLQYMDFAGRPHPVLPSGSPIQELF